MSTQATNLLASGLRILVIIGAEDLELLMIYLSLRVGLAYFRVSATIVLLPPTTNEFMSKGCRSTAGGRLSNLRG